ncbi:hypothetical protein BT69DRAFT_1347317 [Atractiella rhizophila]|nr:hypothetical protein BT69DRAFT_1347317 [Atractiella rhizophila]
MFGEEASESPRQPSPWEELYPSTPEGSKVATPPKLHVKQPIPTNAVGTKNSALLNPNAELERGLNDADTWRSLIPEVDETGHIEYKLKLVANTPERFQKLITQLKWRLAEGGGLALYEIGLLDSGTIVGLSREEMDASLDCLRRMADHLGAEVSVVREIEVAGAEGGVREVKRLEGDKTKKGRQSVSPTENPNAISIKGLKGNGKSSRRRTHSSSSGESMEDEDFSEALNTLPDLAIPFFDLTLDEELTMHAASNTSATRRHSTSTKVIFDPELTVAPAPSTVTAVTANSESSATGRKKKNGQLKKVKKSRAYSSNNNSPSSSVPGSVPSMGSSDNNGTFLHKEYQDGLFAPDFSSATSPRSTRNLGDDHGPVRKFVVEVLVKLEEAEGFLDIEGFTPDEGLFD